MCVVRKSLCFLHMAIKAQEIVKTISPLDIYSSRNGLIPSATREHVLPRKFLSKADTNDLNNIFVCTSAVNTHRGILRYDTFQGDEEGLMVINGRTGYIEDFCMDLVGHPDYCLKSKHKFMPPPHSRGAIARTCMYMADKNLSYEKIIHSHVLDLNVLEEWNYLYPVNEWEILRSNNIFKLGYPKNKFVLQKK
jgi:endonuclease I